MSYEKYDVIVNGHSGFASRFTPQELESYMKRMLGDRAGEVKLFYDYKMNNAVADWHESNTDPKRGLIVAGGDGTLLHVLPHYTDKGERVLIPFPMGTFSLLANDLGFKRDEESFQRQLDTAEIREIDYGTVNNKPFASIATFGKIEGSYMSLRECWRAKDGIAVAMHAMNIVWMSLFGARTKIEVEIDGQTQIVKGSMIVVSVNELMDKKQASRDPRAHKGIKSVGNNLMRDPDKMTDGDLVMYVVDGGNNPFSRIAGLYRLMRYGLHGNPHVQKIRASEMTIHSAENNDKPTRITLDGDPTYMDGAAGFTLKNHRRGLRVLAPTV